MSGTSEDDGVFDRDTALAAGAAGELRGSLCERWRAAGGPHGGYVAALMLRGLMIALGDRTRAPLTLTVHGPFGTGTIQWWRAAGLR